MLCSNRATAYTEDWRNVLKPLNKVVVEAARWKWVEDTLDLLAPKVHPPLVRRLPKTEREVTDLLLGKPSQKPSRPSYYHILPVVRKCETQSYGDLSKMWIAMMYCCLMTDFVENHWYAERNVTP